jgi:serine/threonine protein kinase
VYALGVILFELLVHRLPQQLENRPLADAVRLILDEDAPRLGSIDPDLRGDVETIVAKALEKNPARRYPSAADLAADLRRWLAHEPILARPPSALYHLRKFARRHKGLVGGVLASGLALILGLVGTTLFAIREAHQRSHAEHNAQEANEEKREGQFQRRTAPESPPRLRPLPRTMWRMPRATSLPPRNTCVTGNGGTCTAGSTIAPG